MRAGTKGLILAATASLMISCGDVLDGSTSDGISLEQAERDGGGGGGSTGCTTCRIFLSSTNSAANFGATAATAIAAADARCMADAGKPAGSSTYKALIGVSGLREPPSTDWPIKASTAYVRADGTTAIGTSTAGRIFSFPLTNSVVAAFNYAWTGLSPTWTLGLNCQNWTSNDGSGTHRGALGTTDSLDGNFVGASANSLCNFAVRIYCVEQ